MVKPKHDCTGKKFGLLTVIGKSTIQPRSGRREFGWELLCECGNIIVRVRGDFDKRLGIKSCGCSTNLLKKKNSGLKTENLQGRRFGELTVLETVKGWNTETTRIRASNRCECDCGAIVWRTSTQLKTSRFLNCRGKHHLIGPKFPPMPNPMPDRVAELIEKYMYLVIGSQYQKVRSDIQDEKSRRLDRVAWIIAYRESNGEFLSEDYIRNYILKWLRNSGRAIACKTNNFRYNKSTRKLTGGEMTNPTSYYDAVKVLETETQQKSCLSRRISFKRR